MKKTILILLVIMMSFISHAQKSEKKKVSKNKMNVSWYYENDRIYFEMSAPTGGWVTIGFNSKQVTTGAYLLMGNVVNNKANLVEHYTKSPGDYSPITKLGAQSQVENIEGIEADNNTILKFSLPIKALSKYQKDLSQNKEYVMIIAFSQEDDFQHHSIMRTSINIQL